MIMAHGTTLAAHLGAGKSTKKALLLACMGARGHAQVLPDMPAWSKGQLEGTTTTLAAIGERFQHVAVDIVGPLSWTKRGNRYILTLMDFASRYLEA